MKRVVFIELGDNFSFRHTAQSHGWSDLQPFNYDDEAVILTGVFSVRKVVIPVTIIDAGRRLRVEFDGDADGESVASVVRHVLRIDDDLTDFYDLAKADPELRWAAELRAGRLLRSQTVWEDLVKTICTTNCSWGLTRNMVTNLVDALGPASANGRKAFPGPEVMARQSTAFFNDEVRAGYRSQYLFELSQIVAVGKLDPEGWLSSSLPTIELKKEIKKVKGVGDYAAENLLKLLGRYDGLALDSWLRSQYYARYNDGNICSDEVISEHYAHFEKWQGLAIWCDLTKQWFD